MTEYICTYCEKAFPYPLSGVLYPTCKTCKKNVEELQSGHHKFVAPVLTNRPSKKGHATVQAKAFFNSRKPRDPATTKYVRKKTTTPPLTPKKQKRRWKPETRNSHHNAHRATTDLDRQLDRLLND